MTSSDIILFIAQLVTAWSLGFAGGWTITIFQRAMNHTI